MLIIWRCSGERIAIGGGIEIAVHAECGRAKFAIDAPRDVDIIRSELLDRSEESNGNKEQRVNNAP